MPHESKRVVDTITSYLESVSEYDYRVIREFFDYLLRTPVPGQVLTNTDQLPEGLVNKYYTDARVSANPTVVSKVDKPQPATDKAVVRFSGTTGAMQNSLTTIADSGDVTVNKGVTNRFTRITDASIGFSRNVDGNITSSITSNSTDTMTLDSRTLVRVTGLSSTVNLAWFQLFNNTTPRVTIGSVQAATDSASTLHVHGTLGVGTGLDYRTGSAPANGAKIEGRVLIGKGTDDAVSALQVNGRGNFLNRVYMGAPNLVPADAELANNQMVWYIDEAANQLKAKVKYSTGVVKTATIALV